MDSSLLRREELRGELGNKWTQISKMMNAENRLTQKGKNWYPSTIMKCVLRFERDNKQMDIHHNPRASKAKGRSVSFPIGRMPV